MAKTQTKTVSERAEVLMTIVRDRPELITDDLIEHVNNLMIFGASVLFQKAIMIAPGDVAADDPAADLTPDPPKEEG